MIALVDCNNFFASCERLFRPDLINKPIAVLSNNDGCIVARSNEVRKLGVPMGIPYFKVRDLLTQHNVQVFSSNFALYSNMSQRIISQLHQFAPEVEVYSIDEAFMDLSTLSITNYHKWGTELKKQIEQATGIPVSVGIAPTKTLAKLASEYSKSHDGVLYIDPKKKPQTYETVLKESEVGALWGVGRQLAKRFNAVGIHNAWQLAGSSKQWLHSHMGITGYKMHAELLGDAAYVVEEEKKPQKSVIASRSFGHQVGRLSELEAAIVSFTSQAAARLRKFELTAGLFGVYMSYRDKEGKSKHQSMAVKLLPHSNDTSELAQIAANLTSQLYQEGVGYKKAGVFAYHLQPSGLQQGALLDSKSPDDRQRQAKLMKAVDEINQRYGTSTIELATIDPRQSHWQGKKERMSPAYTTSWQHLPKVQA